MAHALLRILALIWLLTSSAAAQEVTCFEALQIGCFRVQVNVFKYDPTNPLHKGVSDPKTGKTFYDEHAFEWDAFIRSGNGSPPNGSKNVYFVLWSTSKITDTSLAAATKVGAGRWKKVAFRNVTRTFTVPPIHTGDPQAVYLVQTNAVDGRAVSMTFPMEFFKEESYILVIVEDSVYPASLERKRTDESQKEIYGFWADRNLIKKFYEKPSSGITFVALYEE